MTAIHDDERPESRREVVTPLKRETAQQLLDACTGIPVICTASPEAIAEAKKQGERIEGRDGDHYCIGYLWQGQLYVTETSLDANPPSGMEKQDGR